ncbi:hypothetical protein TorRG33x02_229290 [Trema orientale]|uniref:Uncharacterized protein n=1 Tax=Trema orientale TaxID=63057 RepID=A0A2P5E6W7_TREOI|nr:hypothetical protein TorRG33x02_229290 [Trema orientale]
MSEGNNSSPINESFSNYENPFVGTQNTPSHFLHIVNDLKKQLQDAQENKDSWEKIYHDLFHDFDDLQRKYADMFEEFSRTNIALSRKCMELDLTLDFLDNTVKDFQHSLFSLLWSYKLCLCYFKAQACMHSYVSA